MKLLLVGNYFPDKQKSMAAYARLLSEALILQGISVSVVYPSPVLLSSPLKKIFPNKLLGYADKFILFPVKLFSEQQKYDWTHICDHGNSLYLQFARFGRMSITCHDVIAIRAGRGLVPELRFGTTGRLFQRLILKSLAKANWIFCVSFETRSQLVGIDPDRAQTSSVVHNPLNADFSPAACHDARTPAIASTVGGADYFLHVGSGLERKNRGGALRIFAELRRSSRYADASMIFVGPGPDWEMQTTLTENNLHSVVRFIPDVSHTQLVELYRNAVALIFPSLSEGFGWPIIEAQACGCPVFASNRAPLPEVGGSAALYFDPVAESVQIIAKRILDCDLQEMRQAGIANAQRFSTTVMAATMLEKWHEI